MTIALLRSSRICRRGIRLIVAVAFLAAAQAGNATTVVIETDAAKAMLSAIGNPRLTLAQAMAVVQMKGNQGIIAKLIEFKIPASNESFAKAVYDTAHGVPITDAIEKSYFLDGVQSNGGAIETLLESIDGDPDHFQRAIEKRISEFTPQNADIHLSGYVVAGGDGGGYAFGGNDFYLNVGIVHDVLLARAVTNHEMYHAVQGSFARDRGTRAGEVDASVCSATQRLFENIYEEGSAVYVEDQQLVDQSTDPIAVRKKTDIEDGLKHIGWSASLLEMSIDALKSNPPMRYDDVYAVGFYGHGMLYTIGYRMALAIVDQGGDAALTEFLKRPAYDFVLSYVRLPKYGLDADHPKLHPDTIAAAEALAAGCK